MADERRWRRPYEDNYGDEERDWRRESRDYYGYPGDRDRDWERDRGYRSRDWYGRTDWEAENRGSRYRQNEDYWRSGPDWPRDRRGYYGRESWDRGGAWGYDDSWGRDPGFGAGWEPVGYGRAGYGRDRYGERFDYGNRGARGRDRSWWDRASDEVSSWFGDDEAARRRERDRGGYASTYYRGRGPRGYTRSDDRIREDVSDRLTDNPILDATDIEVSVTNGEVTLTGHVDSRYSKRLAEDIADEVSGVRHVQNNLRVRDSGLRERESISGTYSGIAEQGRTSDLGRIERSGTSGSSGVGNTTGSMSGSMARSGETATGAPADTASTQRR